MGDDAGAEGVMAMQGAKKREHAEHHKRDVVGWLRAAVLGANDGVVSTASLVLGVAAADASSGTVATAGIAGLVGGALSMAAGEDVSVSSQRDAELAELAKEREELTRFPQAEREELIGIYVEKGLSRALAEQVADALVEKEGALEVHAREELHIEVGALARPLQAAVVSAVSFSLGAALPLVAITVSPLGMRAPLTLLTAMVTLAGLGAWSARLAGAPVARATGRVLVGGALAMGVTYAIGALLGTGIS